MTRPPGRDLHVLLSPTANGRLRSLADRGHRPYGSVIEDALALLWWQLAMSPNEPMNLLDEICSRYETEESACLKS